MIAQAEPVDSQKTLEAHFLGKVFPKMGIEQYSVLLEDVRAHGVREPGTLYEGKILDGSNRYRASQEAGKPMQWEEYEGNDPVGFVISKNLARRHLTTSQAACVAALLQQKLKHTNFIPNPNGYSCWKPSPGRPKRGYENQTSTKVAAIFNIARSTLEKAVTVLHRDPKAFHIVMNNPKERLEAAWRRLHPKAYKCGRRVSDEVFALPVEEVSLPKVFDSWDQIEQFDIQLREKFDLEIRYVPKTGNGSMGLKHLLIGAARQALNL